MGLPVSSVSWMYLGDGRGCFHFRRCQMSSLEFASSTLLLKNRFRAFFIVLYQRVLFASVLDVLYACFASEQAWVHHPAYTFSCTTIEWSSNAWEIFSQVSSRL